VAHQSLPASVFVGRVVPCKALAVPTAGIRSTRVLDFVQTVAQRWVEVDSRNLGGGSRNQAGDSNNQAGDSSNQAGDSNNQAGDSNNQAGDSRSQAGDNHQNQNNNRHQRFLSYY
jgi:hypothetical protein